MSNKPEKKSDENKKWMTSRYDRRSVAIAPEYHLIITEGEKTEPNYFKALKEEINKKYPGRISIDIEGIGEGTTKLLKRAQKIVRSSSIEYKHVWIVYDKDEFLDEDFDSTASACKSLSDSNVMYHALWSNECIEYWFLLHFVGLFSEKVSVLAAPLLSKQFERLYV